MQENILGLEGKGRQQRRALHHADSMKGWAWHCLVGRGCPTFMPQKHYIRAQRALSTSISEPLGLSVCTEG